ncbi:GDSL-type esterase/lipase family protein [Catenovulum sp. 2E275]|uniref:SGNH/GDSL hydrolase family protein n=1 Tax=Catenovulum sp. 2E275 TaxID=2980497 RepID=UPI0021CE78A0|nr:SGNH/GDSL hydrolase family protein [Catenovulum sp. 2E275]MCU4677382.1 GDSL-type esterase/lipase family protein [Catenovulum sp. 2E275]
MKKIIRSFVYLVLICQVVFISKSFALTEIKPTDDGFLYTGRVGFNQQKQAIVSWPGTSIKANITGDQLIVVMDDDNGKNFFNVIINGEDNYPAVLSLKKGTHEYDLSYLLFNRNNKANQIEIFKRTEGHEGASRFLGFKLADGAKLLAAPKPLKRKIAYFGDSITSGMGNEGADNGKDDLESEKNHYLSYAAITARNLNAEFHTTSLSGIGFMVSWFDFIMPQYYDQLSAAGNNDTLWDFKQWQPDLVVVNLGQNDSWLIDNEKRLQPEPSEREIINAYKGFINQLKAVYPDARFICALGSMDATKAERKHWVNYIKTGVDELNQADPKHKIEFITFDFNGYYAHPRVAQHVDNANKLTAKIKQVMGW